jgi:PncC family amidohydrolase
VEGSPSTLELATRLGELLTQRGWSLAVAESCTGGMLGAAITDVPGSSRYFLGGVISYSDRVKLEQLGVSAATLASHGAVSSQTAEAMASGVRRLLHADLGVSVTGVAGPGAEGSKPVGLTYIGIAVEGRASAHRYHWSWGRLENRKASVVAALELAIEAAGVMS